MSGHQSAWNSRRNEQPYNRCEMTGNWQLWQALPSCGHLYLIYELRPQSSTSRQWRSGQDVVACHTRKRTIQPKGRLHYLLQERSFHSAGCFETVRRLVKRTRCGPLHSLKASGTDKVWLSAQTLQPGRSVTALHSLSSKPAFKNVHIQTLF